MLEKCLKNALSLDRSSIISCEANEALERFTTENKTKHKTEVLEGKGSVSCLLNLKFCSLFLTP